MITIDLNGGLDYYRNRYKVVYTCPTDGLMFQVRLNADSLEDALVIWENLEMIKSTRLSYKLIEIVTEKDWGVE